MPLPIEKALLLPGPSNLGSHWLILVLRTEELHCLKPWTFSLLAQEYILNLVGHHRRLNIEDGFKD